jgi:hypothetical protein
MQLKHEASKSAMHRENERVMDATCACMQISAHVLFTTVPRCLPHCLPAAASGDEQGEAMLF